MKILIVGGGLTGACCAFALVRSGHEVVVLESGNAGEGTTNNSGSAILYQSKDNDLFVEMTRRSMELWDELRDLGIAPFRRDGSHVLFSGDDEEAFAVKRANFLAGHGVKVERLDRAALENVLPGLHHLVTGSYFCAEDGEANPYQSCMGITTAAKAAGASFIFNDAFKDIEFSSRGITGAVAGSGRRIPCDAIILAAGAGTAQLASQFGVPLAVSPERGEQLLTPPMPLILKGRILNVRYMRGKTLGAFAGLALGQEPDGRLKIGSTREPGQSELVTSERGRDALLEEMSLCLPHLASLPIARHTVGIRMSSASGRPIVAQLPSHAGLFAIDGLGGNGVAFAPLIAELAVKLVEGKSDRIAAELKI